MDQIIILSDDLITLEFAFHDGQFNSREWNLVPVGSKCLIEHVVWLTPEDKDSYPPVLVQVVRLKEENQGEENPRPCISIVEPYPEMRLYRLQEGQPVPSTTLLPSWDAKSIRMEFPREYIVTEDSLFIRVNITFLPDELQETYFIPLLGKKGHGYELGSK